MPYPLYQYGRGVSARTRPLPSPAYALTPDSQILHAAQPLATVVVGDPSRDCGVELVEPEQSRAPVFQPNVQGQVVGAALALLYGPAHPF